MSLQRFEEKWIGEQEGRDWMREYYRKSLERLQRQRNDIDQQIQEIQYLFSALDQKEEKSPLKDVLKTDRGISNIPGPPPGPKKMEQLISEQHKKNKLLKTLQKSFSATDDWVEKEPKHDTEPLQKLPIKDLKSMFNHQDEPKRMSDKEPPRRVLRDSFKVSEKERNVLEPTKEDAKPFIAKELASSKFESKKVPAELILEHHTLSRPAKPATMRSRRRSRGSPARRNSQGDKDGHLSLLEQAVSSRRRRSSSLVERGREKGIRVLEGPTRSEIQMSMSDLIGQLEASKHKPFQKKPAQ